LGAGPAGQVTAVLGGVGIPFHHEW
jgi:hypothetical protein